MEKRNVVGGIGKKIFLEKKKNVVERTKMRKSGIIHKMTVLNDTFFKGKYDVY